MTNAGSPETNHLKEIREFLWNNGYRWTAYIDGDAVAVEVVKGREALTYRCKTMGNARWIVRNYP